MRRSRLQFLEHSSDIRGAFSRHSVLQDTGIRADILPVDLPTHEDASVCCLCCKGNFFFTSEDRAVSYRVTIRLCCSNSSAAVALSAECQYAACKPVLCDDFQSAGTNHIFVHSDFQGLSVFTH